jgi:hypothetical protein
MHEGLTVFAQVMDGLPKYELAKCVKRYRGDFHVRSMPYYEQFLIMAFAQLTYRESLRDIQTCLRALGPKLYHSAIRSRPARSTLADASEKRYWRIFADFAHVLICHATELYGEQDRCRLLLHHGPGVSGLQAVAPHRRGSRLLCHSGQERLPFDERLLLRMGVHQTVETGVRPAEPAQQHER